MTVICPKCEARFRDPPAEIAFERALQCGKCEHEWVREAEPQLERPVVDAPSLEPTMQSLIDNRDDMIETKLPVLIEGGSADDFDEARPIFVDSAPEIALRKRSNFLPAVGLALVAMTASAVSLKDIVIEHVPQARSAYSAAGLTSPTPGLEIAGIETSKTTKDGIRQLIIRGEIANVADHQIPVPSLQLTMRGESNVRLYAWTVSAAKDNLKAGERSRFTAVAHDYPGDAVDVEVEFLPQKAK